MDFLVSPRHFTIEKDAHPCFQIQKPPDPISMIAMPRPVLGKKALDHFPPKQSTCRGSWLQQHSFKLIQLGT